MAGWASTGIDGLDNVLTGLEKGDNIVWQVDKIDDYADFVSPYVERAVQQGRRLVSKRLLFSGSGGRWDVAQCFCLEVRP